jgi:2-polyprenyl-3-methyl-5-hydroxy-6-metoxy-1,4-benzoquinol methylase
MWPMSEGEIRAAAHATCDVCGCQGNLVYKELDDVLFGAPGAWSMRRCTNGSCGLFWLDPQPIEKDIGKAYVEYHTHRASTAEPSLPKRMYRLVRASYLRSRLGYDRATASAAWRWLAPLGAAHPAGGDAFAAMAMFLPAQPSNAALLDVGCGGGDFLALMGDLGWKVSGLETDPAAVARARARGLDVREGRLEDATLDTDSFDAVTLAHVIEHVHDPRRVLEECQRILKPGGTLVILTPNNRSWGSRYFGRDWRGLEPPRHIHVFNVSSIKTLLEGTGLTPVRVGTLAINANAVWLASAGIRRARNHASGGGAATTAAAGIARQLAERLRLTVDRDAGEDLLAVATKGS